MKSRSNHSRVEAALVGHAELRINPAAVADALELLADGIKALAEALRHSLEVEIPPMVDRDQTQSTHQMLLTPKQLAAELNVAEQTLAKWRLSGQGPRYGKLGQLVRYDREDVLRWVDERRYAHTADVKKS